MVNGQSVLVLFQLFASCWTASPSFGVFLTSSNTSETHDRPFFSFSSPGKIVGRISNGTIFVWAFTKRNHGLMHAIV